MCRWRSDVNSFPALDGQTSFGPTYVYEYSTRATYGTHISGWGLNDPLNATWWHLVTERETAFTPPTRASLLTGLLFQRWKRTPVSWRYSGFRSLFFADQLTFDRLLKIDVQ